MFYEWVARGAEIWVTAFFALAVFGMICCAIVGLVMMLSSLAEKDREGGAGR